MLFDIGVVRFDIGVVQKIFRASYCTTRVSRCVFFRPIHPTLVSNFRARVRFLLVHLILFPL